MGRGVTLESRAPNDIHQFGSKVLAVSTQSRALCVCAELVDAGVKGRKLLVSAPVRPHGEPWLITTASVLHPFYHIFILFMFTETGADSRVATRAEMVSKLFYILYLHFFN